MRVCGLRGVGFRLRLRIQHRRVCAGGSWPVFKDEDAFEAQMPKYCILELFGYLDVQALEVEHCEIEGYNSLMGFRCRDLH